MRTAALPDDADAFLLGLGGRGKKQSGLGLEKDAISLSAFRRQREQDVAHAV
jgi:hypothetical protein